MRRTELISLELACVYGHWHFHQKFENLKIDSLSFIHCYVILKFYAFLSSVEHKKKEIRYFEEHWEPNKGGY